MDIFTKGMQNEEYYDSTKDLTRESGWNSAEMVSEALMLPW